MRKINSNTVAKVLVARGPAKLTTFQRRVYKALCEVPAGKVTTYKLLAECIGCDSPQAVGQALRRNPYAPTVPCHRVVQTDGGLGGFGGKTKGHNIDKKNFLLKAEGVRFTEYGNIHPDCFHEYEQSHASPKDETNRKQAAGSQAGEKKQFETIAARVAAKRKAPSSPIPDEASQTKKHRVTKEHRTGLDEVVDETSKPFGVVDTECGINGEIHILAEEEAEPCDVMLVCVDPSQNMDKFFVLQLIREKDEDDANDTYVLYTRWGRTGTAGQGLVEKFGQNLIGAVKAFQAKFLDKTGLPWHRRHEPALPGKYRFMIQDFEQKREGYKAGTWQYWVDDGVDGKATGWYDYDPVASQKVERLFSEHSRNADCPERVVQSGYFSYSVDLARMTQTNVTHPSRTTRQIRRC